MKDIFYMNAYLQAEVSLCHLEFSIPLHVHASSGDVQLSA